MGGYFYGLYYGSATDYTGDIQNSIYGPSCICKSEKDLTPVSNYNNLCWKIESFYIKEQTNNGVIFSIDPQLYACVKKDSTYLWEALSYSSLYRKEHYIYLTLSYKKRLGGAFEIAIVRDLDLFTSQTSLFIPWEVFFNARELELLENGKTVKKEYYVFVASKTNNYLYDRALRSSGGVFEDVEAYETYKITWSKNSAPGPKYLLKSFTRSTGI